MTVVTVKPNMKDDYLMGIKKTWVDSCNIQKDLGLSLQRGWKRHADKGAGTESPLDGLLPDWGHPDRMPP